MTHLTFQRLLENKDRGICLFGTGPPRQTTPEETAKVIAQQLVEQMSLLEVDALAIYDVQDELGRSGEERPFPFVPSHHPHHFARYFQDCPSCPSLVVYHALAYHQKEDFPSFLSKAQEDAQCHAIVLVGGSSRHDGLSVADAAEEVRAGSYGFCVGGITLAERHRDRGMEHIIVSQKVERGLSFFTSQVVYNADNAICFLQDYDQLCKSQALTPARIIFTFAPFGRQETADFLSWLGVELPKGTIRRVLSRGAPVDCVREANEICRENLKRILDACMRYRIDVPLGFTAECVSKHKEEARGVAELFRLLKAEMDGYYAQYRLQSTRPARFSR